MVVIDKFEGVKAKVQTLKIRVLFTTLVAAVAIAVGACGGPVSNSSTPGGGDPNETAATVNGKVIKFEEVERAVKQQAQGQESKLSPLELAAARLQVLQTLIEQEVMFQKAEKEGVVPKDEDVTAEINKQKTGSGLSQEEFDKQMKQAGLDEASLRDQVKRKMSIDALVEKITGRIEQPKDGEIEAFFKGNPDMFVKRRGVRLAAIVIDPSNSGEGDVTVDAASADLKLKEVLAKLQQPGSDFAALAREYSEDPSRFQGGDLGFFTEQELKQNYPQLVQGFMNPDFTEGRITNVVPINGKGYIFKLQERVTQEENLTLESPNVRPQIIKLLVDSRKQLLAAAYQTIAMNEAKVDNLLARKVVDNPNELSGARPAAPANANAATTPAATTPPVNVNTTGNTNAASTAPAKPASNTPANAAKPASSSNAPAKNANAGR